jgi:hypothetical protein
MNLFLFLFCWQDAEMSQERYKLLILGSKHLNTS